MFAPRREPIVRILRSQPSVLLIAHGVFVFSLLAGVGQAQPEQRPPSPGQRVRDFNNQLLDVFSRLQSSPAADAPGLKDRAAGIIQERAVAFQELIQQTPSEAAGLAFAGDALANLAAAFPDSAAQLESIGQWEGDLEFLVEDGLQSSRNIYRLHVDGDVLSIHFSGPEPDGLKSGDHLRVSGVRVGKDAAVEKAEAPPETPSSDAFLRSVSSASTCGPKGIQNSVVLLAKFPGGATPAITQSYIHDAFFGTAGRSVSEYWREASYGATTATGDVFGWYTLDNNYTCDQDDAIKAAAIRAADPDVDFTKYSRIFIVFPQGAGCSYAGRATVGCTSGVSNDGSFVASTAWLISDYVSPLEWGVQLGSHEGGHNLGLLHSTSRDFGTDALGAPGTTGTIDEYGDGFSTMGYWNFGHYTAQQKAQLGWLSPTTDVQTVQSNGTFSVQPLETAGGVKALKIQRGSSTTSNWLWLEYRQPLGNYDSALPAQIFSGATIHYQDAATAGKTNLLDFTTSTSSFADPALAVGKTWSDPYTNLSITVNSATSSALSVTVSYSGTTTTCTPGAPVIVISPANPSVTAGNTVNYTVSVTNNDSSACATRTFNISSAQPGWGTTFSQGGLALAPGATGTTTMSIATLASTAPASYAVNAIVTNGSSTVTATANLTVLPACVVATPVVVMTSSSPSASPGGSISFTVSVTDKDPAGCASRTFALSSTLPGWPTVFTPSSLTLSPGGASSASMTISVPTTSSPGTYGVNAGAAGGVSTASASSTLTVLSAPVTPTLSITVSAGPSGVSTLSYSAGSTIPVTANVALGGSAVSNAAVVFTITDPTGRSSTRKVMTTSGVATWNYKVGPKDPKGTYQVTATATYGSSTVSSSTPAKFVVN